MWKNTQKRKNLFYFSHDHGNDDDDREKKPIFQWVLLWLCLSWDSIHSNLHAGGFKFSKRKIPQQEKNMKKIKTLFLSQYEH